MPPAVGDQEQADVVMDDYLAVVVMEGQVYKTFLTGQQKPFTVTKSVTHDPRDGHPFHCN